jgi:phenylalanyl-tRNA synthetase beta chain
MIISVNWLKQFTDIDVSVDELATLIGARLVEIEEVIDLGAKYKDVLVARVVSCEKHADSDHLSVVRLEDGGKADVERDEDGYVQVVCGAPNVREGLLVAWLPPKSTVPETFGTSEPFVLDSRKLRGVMSNGMIASAKELALFDEHDGILELDKENLVPGGSFANAYELNDYLLDIENKSLTHRPDCFGIVGFAREVAAIQGKEFKTPDWLKDLAPIITPQGDDMPSLTVTIDNPELSARYQAVVLRGSDTGPKTPLQLQTYLGRVGVRPISTVVDVTNYLMMLTGQPLHAFDYDKLVAVGDGKAEIHVRAGRENETLQLLDGRIITLTPDDIVIANGETAVALAGAMGGAETEIDENTKNIIIESATFNLYSLRATQMRHGIFSEAITRFTKGQPAELSAPVLANAVELLVEFTGAYPVTEAVEAYPVKTEFAALEVSTEKINDILGSNFTTDVIRKTLQNVEFEVGPGELLKVTAPYWRADIHIPEDIVEEIGRINGFDDIDPVLPPRDFTAVRPSSFDVLRTKTRDILVRAGANEVLTYSFIHGDTLKKAGQNPENSYRIVNSISPELQYYRQTLTPSLLGLIHGNIKQGYDEFALFELNKVHPKNHGLTGENVPDEIDMLALTFASKKADNVGYYQAKAMLDYLGESLGLNLVYEPIESEPNYPVTTPFEYRRSAIVTDKNTGTFLGIVGEYKKPVTRNFKLPAGAAGFEIGTQPLYEAVRKLTPGYKPLSRYPGTERDICFQVGADVNYGQLVQLAQEELVKVELETSIEPVDIYKASNSPMKNITIRIKITSHEKTLTSEEVNSITENIARTISGKTGAVVI